MPTRITMGLLLAAFSWGTTAMAQEGAQITLPGRPAAVRDAVLRAMQHEGYFAKEVAACDCVIRSEWKDVGRQGLRAVVAVLLQRGDSVDVFLTGRTYLDPVIELGRQESRMRAGDVVAGPGRFLAEKAWEDVLAIANRLRMKP